MRLLLDEMMPKRLVALFSPETQAITVRQRGWAEKANGELLALAQHEFDALVTMDKGIEHQQNIADLVSLVPPVYLRYVRLGISFPLLKSVVVSVPDPPSKLSASLPPQ